MSARNRPSRGGEAAVNDSPFDVEMRRVCVEVAKALGLRGATITVMASLDAEATVAASDAAIEDVAEMQFDLGEGPSPDCFASGAPVLVPDVAATEGRWLAFASAVAAAGISGVYAFPLGLGALRLGVLTCYTGAGYVLDQRDLVRGLETANVATELLLNQHLLSWEGASVRSAPDVQTSLHIRSEVYQAQGMVMVDLGVTLSDALALLRATAYAKNIELNRLAADVVAGRRTIAVRRDDA